MLLSISNRVNTLLLMLLALLSATVIAILATRSSAGPLNPVSAPASTMKTLDDIPGSWSHAYLANDGPDACHSSRFLCVLPTASAPTGAAVLDHETGLVWQRVPASTSENWQPAIEDCMSSNVGGRSGWRLPQIEEYKSLLDATGGLPSGHPFSGILVGASDYYWSSSTDVGNASLTYPQTFGTAFPYVSIAKTQPFGEHAWCVRGGAGLEGI